MYQLVAVACISGGDSGGGSVVMHLVGCYRLRCRSSGRVESTKRSVNEGEWRDVKGDGVSNVEQM